MHHTSKLLNNIYFPYSSLRNSIRFGVITMFISLHSFHLLTHIKVMKVTNLYYSMSLNSIQKVYVIGNQRNAIYSDCARLFIYVVLPYTTLRMRDILRSVARDNLSLIVH